MNSYITLQARASVIAQRSPEDPDYRPKDIIVNGGAIFVTSYSNRISLCDSIVQKNDRDTSRLEIHHKFLGLIWLGFSSACVADEWLEHIRPLTHLNVKDKYSDFKRIGAGSNGIVTKARCKKTGKLVALKLVALFPISTS